MLITAIFGEHTLAFTHVEAENWIVTINEGELYIRTAKEVAEVLQELVLSTFNGLPKPH